MDNQECVFCNLDPGRIIKAGKLFTSFLSNPRLKTGHSLVVPNRHVEKPGELTAGEAIDMGSEALRIGERLIGEFAVGIDYWMKSRPEVAENEIKVNHVHTHVIPSQPEDEIYSSGLIWTPDRFHPLTLEEQDRMVKTLREPGS